MSTVLGERSLPDTAPRRWWPWLAVAAGLLALYVPTYIGLARTLWRDDDYAHGPIILAVFVWLAFRALRKPGTDHHLPYSGTAVPPAGKWWSVPGFLFLVLGLVLYAVGRSQGIALFEVASHFPVIVGVLLMMGGVRLVRRFAFPLLFLFFLIPLPGFVLETISTPLKTLVSSAVEVILQVAGYPVERAGVVLNVGGHEMLVADACSGLNSLYSLGALTLLYTYLTGPSSRARWAILLASVVPIAIAANVIRVFALVLVTYHLGEETAQGFLHGFAGMLVFVTAFLMLLGVDRIIRHKVIPAKAGIQTEAHAHGLGSRLHGNDVPRTRSWPAFAAAILMIGAAVAAPQMKPVHAEGTGPDLQSLVPTAFGDWSIDPSIVPIPPTPEVQTKLDRIYSQTLSRTYVNSKGEHMMLTVAYGGDQSDALKAHRQEVCYTAQGFTIHGLEHASLALGERSIPVTRMLAVRGDRAEPVTYWFTMGDRVVLGRVERLKSQLASGLAGRIPDGMLVRVSSISANPTAAYASQQAFTTALIGAMPARDGALFVGAGRT